MDIAGSMSLIDKGVRGPILEVPMDLLRGSKGREEG